MMERCECFDGRTNTEMLLDGEQGQRWHHWCRPPMSQHIAFTHGRCSRCNPSLPDGRQVWSTDVFCLRKPNTRRFCLLDLPFIFAYKNTCAAGTQFVLISLHVWFYRWDLRRHRGDFAGIYDVYCIHRLGYTFWKWQNYSRRLVCVWFVLLPHERQETGGQCDSSLVLKPTSVLTSPCPMNQCRALLFERSLLAIHTMKGCFILTTTENACYFPYCQSRDVIIHC